MSADRRWFMLGRFRIFAKPLELNPRWTTHHIYLDGKCIGKQLSVPSEADCEHYLAQSGSIARTRVVIQTFSIHRKAGPGRPARDRNYREWLAEVASE